MKLRGLQDKYLLRRMAQRWLPRSLAWRRRTMFRAPFDIFAGDALSPYIEQLLSEEALKKTDYFNIDQVQRWRRTIHRLSPNGRTHFVAAIGLAGVAATQLWHHLFIDVSLADSWERTTKISGDSEHIAKSKFL